MCLGDIGVVSVSYLLRVCVSVTISSSRGVCVCVHASRVAWVSVSMWEGCGGALGVLTQQAGSTFSPLQLVALGLSPERVLVSRAARRVLGWGQPLPPLAYPPPTPGPGWSLHLTLNCEIFRCHFSEGETESSTRPLILDRSLYIPQHCCGPRFFNM